MKKESKKKAEKVYLKKGSYALNDIYYVIFLSSNGKHYFSFVNKLGRTVLLNGDIKGFETLEEAESSIEQVLKFAQQKGRFEIKTAKDGKFYFNLYNDKGEKIAKSFFFRKREDIDQSLNEFIVGKPSSKINTSVAQSIDRSTSHRANIIPINQNTTKKDPKNSLDEKALKENSLKIEAEKKREEEKLLADKKWQEEKRAFQIEKEKKAKETEILLAAKKQKREEDKIRKKNERIEAARIAAAKKPKNDDDLFDGCFKWLWILLVLLFLALILSYFKGCFGNQNNSYTSTSPDARMVDTLDNNEIYSDQDIVSSTNENQDAIDISTGKNNNTSSKTESGGVSNDVDENKSSSVQSDGYENSTTDFANCNCGDKAIVFKIPNTPPKSISKLGTNPQFGNTHGLSAADFMEELNYRFQNSTQDHIYLNYLFKAMGYSGFNDAKASQFSQESLKYGATGILGFGSYNGYAYYQLDLNEKDLEVFRIEAANGCHINFMKTCGNFFFSCK